MNWISVKNKLPKEYDRCLVYKSDVAIMCYGVAIYSGKKFRFDSTCLPDSKCKESVMDKAITGVTHWISIEPPE